MPNDVNLVLIAGRVTREPEARTSAGGTVWARLGLAVNRWIAGRDGGQGREVADFVDGVAFDHLAERLPGIATKGSLVLVRGRLSTQERDGNHVLGLVLEDVQLLASATPEHESPLP